MAHGGKRPGAGRKTSVARVRTRAVADAIASDGELTPLEYLTSVYRDPSQDDAARRDAAKAAAPYVHPRLSAIEHSGPDGGAIATTQRVERVFIDPFNPDSPEAPAVP